MINQKLIHKADPKSRLVVISNFTHVRPSSVLMYINTFQNLTKQHNVQVINSGTVGLTEWIIDDTCLVFFAARLSNTRRYRSLSPVYDGPIGILTSESPKSKKENSVSASSSSSSTVLTAPLVRRLRSKVKVRTNSLWFTGKTPNSFNSLCSSRYDRKELQTGSKHYFFYQVLPRAQKG